ncbi:hypothetical protein M3661_17010 [Paenibacillus sp. MER 180]|uniref:P27 family phage terminase small subunit n=1 Tax=Paenibacillus sp. MER 180 TaxID=2939570 RepID=UPI0020401215|nr:P27 family phage terminase small subunit [Paenibacillus sp. MER 180]MCM3291832.1 hypothetical protein [Paenibacillus sp. MER 180]
MADVDRNALRKRIENDLKKQLKANGTTVNYHKDMVSDYMSLWDLKNELLDDIKANGIKVSGMHGPKSNPAINDLHKTNDRMIKILDALNLNVPKAEPNTSGKTSKSDLV